MDNARFEVIQNTIVRKYTFYLDKVEGKVYQLVKTRTGGYSWEEMTIYPKDTQTYTEPIIKSTWVVLPPLIRF